MTIIHLIAAIAFGVLWGFIIYRAENLVGRKKTLAVALCGGGFALLATCAYIILGFEVWHLLVALLVAVVVRYWRGRSRSEGST